MKLTSTCGQPAETAETAGWGGSGVLAPLRPSAWHARFARAVGLLRSRTGATVAGYASANLMTLVVTLAGSFIQARYVDPADLGLFRSFGILTTYLFFLQAGVFDGLQRELPCLMGSGRTAHAGRLASACLAWVLLWSVVGTLGYGAVAIAALVRGDWRAALGWGVQVVVLVGFLYGGYLQTTYRTSGDFNRISRGKFISGMASLAVLPLFVVASYGAMALRAAVMPLADMLVLHRSRPLRRGPRVDIRALGEVMKIGIPRSAVAYLESSLWVALEATLVLHLLGHAALGLLSFATMVTQALAIVPLAIYQVFLPRIAHEYGQSGSLARAARVAILPTLAGVGIALGVVTLCGVAGGPAIRMLLPRYGDAVTPMLLYSLVVVATSGRMLVYALAAFGSVTQYALATGVALATFGGVSLGLALAGFGLNGIIVGSVIGRFVHIGLAGTFLVRLCRREARGLRTATGVEPAEAPVVG